MNFKMTARQVRQYMQVDVEIHRSQHDLGLHDETEQNALAEALLSAVYDLRHPQQREAFPEWFARRLEVAGVPLPTPEAPACTCGGG